MNPSFHSFRQRLFIATASNQGHCHLFCCLSSQQKHAFNNGHKDLQQAARDYSQRNQLLCETSMTFPPSQRSLATCRAGRSHCDANALLSNETSVSAQVIADSAAQVIADSTAQQLSSTEITQKHHSTAENGNAESSPPQYVSLSCSEALEGSLYAVRMRNRLNLQWI